MRGLRPLWIRGLLLATVLVALSGCQTTKTASKDASWPRYSSPDGKFTVRFPPRWVYRPISGADLGEAFASSPDVVGGVVFGPTHPLSTNAFGVDVAAPGPKVRLGVVAVTDLSLLGSTPKAAALMFRSFFKYADGYRQLTFMPTTLGKWSAHEFTFTTNGTDASGRTIQQTLRLLFVEVPGAMVVLSSGAYSPEFASYASTFDRFINSFAWEPD